MPLRFSMSDIPHLTDREIFFDANILIFLYCPMGNVSEERIGKYSSIFNCLLRQKNILSVNEMVLSELVNRFLRIEFSNKCKNKNEFKRFRNSNDGISAQREIYDIVKNKILNVFEFRSMEFRKKEIDDMLFVDSLDFNDKLIVNVCKEYDMILLTDDSDYKNSDIDILSSNPKLR